MPAVAVGLTLAGLLLAYHFLVGALPSARQPASGGRAPGGKPVPFAQHLHAARERMSEGSFRLALATLEQARREAGGDWSGLPRGERHQWTRLSRQAALLGDLLAEPLEDLVRHAAGVKEAEWLAEFRERYHGRAVVFDLVVQRGAGGAVRHNYCFPSLSWQARLELGQLALFRRLPLDQPRRLVFGVRLAGVDCEPPGTWVVRPQPDSGLLLTDRGAAAACCAGLADATAQALLEQQAGWAVDDP
jgi:hypothetical protein